MSWYQDEMFDKRTQSKHGITLYSPAGVKRTFKVTRVIAIQIDDACLKVTGWEKSKVRSIRVPHETAIPSINFIYTTLYGCYTVLDKRIHLKSPVAALKEHPACRSFLPIAHPIPSPPHTLCLLSVKSGLKRFASSTKYHGTLRLIACTLSACPVSQCLALLANQISNRAVIAPISSLPTSLSVGRLPTALHYAMASAGSASYSKVTPVVAPLRWEQTRPCGFGSRTQPLAYKLHYREAEH